MYLIKYATGAGRSSWTFEDVQSNLAIDRFQTLECNPAVRALRIRFVSDETGMCVWGVRAAQHKDVRPFCKGICCPTQKEDVLVKARKLYTQATTGSSADVTAYMLFLRQHAMHTC